MARSVLFLTHPRQDPMFFIRLIAVAGVLISGALASASEQVRIGYGHVPPITYRDEKGQPAGFAVDVLNEAARRAGIRLKWVTSGNSRQIEDQLRSGGLDLVPAGMVTEERRRNFYVSDPWWFTELDVLTKPGISAAEMSGKRIGLASPLYRLPAQQEFPHSLLIPFESASAASEVCRGNVDGILVTHGDLHDFLRERPKACAGTDLQTFDSDVVIDLGVISRRDREPVARRLRARIDEMALDGTLAQMAGRHPPLSTSGAVRLAATLKARYERRTWEILLAWFLGLLAVSGWFILRQQRTQARLRHQTELLQRVIDTIPVMIAVRDARSGTFTVNREFERVLGWGPEKYESLVADAGESDWRDVRLVAKDGTPVDSSWARAVLSDGTRVAIGIDVRERLRAEQALREAGRLEMIGSLAGGVAHEFNNILTIISGNVGLVLDDLGSKSEARAPLSAALEASGRATELTRQLLAYAGKGSAIRRRVDVSAAAQDAIQLLRPTLAGNIDLRADLAPNLPHVVMDPGQLQQIFVNLVLNAAESFGGNQTPCITVRTALEEACVLIEVSDNGCGMDEETQKRIFDPFFSTKFPGRGLGMAAVHGIVRTSNGRIYVESAAGRGTRVRILFPKVSATREAEIAAEDAQPSGGGAVLIVDDEPAIRRMSAAVLRKRGIQVFEAANGKEAIECFRTHGVAISVMILDVTMPELNGDEALPEIARLRPDLHVIVSSGHADADVRRRFTAMRLTAVLPKPYTGSELLAQVVPALKG